MLNRETILQEFKVLAPGLSSLTLENPYQVPTGYFESFPDLMMMMVSEKASDVLKNNKENAYQVPAGYFENLSNVLLSKVKALENGSVKEELEVLSPLLNSLNRKNPFTIPEGYFEELPSNITEGAKAIDLVNEELENLSPLMTDLKYKNVYEVPSGYFDTVAIEALKKAKQQQPAKVISMNFGRKLMQYAVAAMITGLIIVSAVKIINNPVTGAGEDPVAKVTDTEIQQFLDNNGSVVEPVLTTTTSEESTELTADDMKEMLADIPDEELQRYVDQSGENNNVINN